MALEKARGAKVKEFAQFERDEQTTVGEILKSMDPDLGSPTPPADVTQALEKLQQMKPGEAFDREFILPKSRGTKCCAQSRKTI